MLNFLYFNCLLIMIIYEHVLCFTESFTTPGRFFFTEGIHCWMGEIFHPVWLSPQTIHAASDITGRETSWECPAKEDTGGGESCQKGLWFVWREREREIRLYFQKKNINCKLLNNSVLLNICQPKYKIDGSHLIILRPHHLIHVVVGFFIKLIKMIIC